MRCKKCGKQLITAYLGAENKRRKMCSPCIIKSKKKIFYDRTKPSGVPAGFGWHTASDAVRMRKKGFKMKRVKNQ